MWLTQHRILPKFPWLCINKVMNAWLWEWCWLCSTWESVEGTRNTVAFEFYEIMEMASFFPPLNGVMEQ